MAFQKTIIQGNIGKIGQLEYTNTGVATLKFSVAVGEKYKGEDKTTWYPVKCFKGTAETISKHFIVGDTILLDGKMNFFNYDKDGVKVYSYEMVALSFSFCGGKKKQEGQQQPQNNFQQAPPQQGSFQQQGNNQGGGFSQHPDDDQIPFAPNVA